MLTCPLGHGDLHTESHLELEVAVCEECGGEWLHHDELEALESATVHDATVIAGMREYSPHESDRRCPVCQAKLYEFDYRANPLELDACPQGHGYWLDGGEEARVRDLILQRARDLHRAAGAEESFGQFMTGIRGKLGGRGGHGLFR
jgi:Zn-finger nucleic acid-binding protein